MRFGCVLGGLIWPVDKPPGPDAGRTGPGAEPGIPRDASGHRSPGQRPALADPDTAPMTRKTSHSGRSLCRCKIMSDRLRGPPAWPVPSDPPPSRLPRDGRFLGTVRLPEVYDPARAKSSLLVMGWLRQPVSDDVKPHHFRPVKVGMRGKVD